jgi:hypothetical protein
MHTTPLVSLLEILKVVSNSNCNQQCYHHSPQLLSRQFIKLGHCKLQFRLLSNTLSEIICLVMPFRANVNLWASSGNICLLNYFTCSFLLCSSRSGHYSFTLLHLLQSVLKATSLNSGIKIPMHHILYVCMYEYKGGPYSWPLHRDL